MNIQELIEESYETAKEKGWWNTDRNVMECLMLMVTELAEAAEDYRKFGTSAEAFLFTEENGKPSGIASELADVLIRIGDMCGKWNIPLEKALEMKMEYNKSRPYRHGGKLA